MVSKNKIIMPILFIFILILIFIFFIVNNNLYKNEYFENNTNYIQSGTGVLKATGTIIFQQPFGNAPIVFIQANNGSSSSVVINTKNITNIGFSYIKNVISETTTGSFTTLVMEEDNIDTFNWVAIDTTNINNKINNSGSSGNGCCNVSNNNPTQASS
jgi:SNF family Na+-dependent transporter